MKRPQWKKILPDAPKDSFQNERMKELRRDAQAEYKRIMDSCDHLEDADLSRITDHCIAVALIAECHRIIALEGSIIEGDRGIVRNPAFTVLSQQRDLIKVTSKELGLSPEGRKKQSPQVDDTQNSPFD